MTILAMITGSRALASPAFVATKQMKRHFFAYFRISFNKVDKDRLAKVGPDRLCAEWILKNGGMVSFVGENITKNYNALPNENRQKVVGEVDATGSSIMAIGFDHFQGCKGIEKIILNKCKHMENEALEKLSFVKDSLTYLEVVECFNVTDDGLRTLKDLKNLNTLVIASLPYVTDISSVEKELKANLPNCKMDIKNIK